MIDGNKTLTATKATDPFYDKELKVDTGAPKVVFFMITTENGKLPSRTMYPLDFKRTLQNVQVPRLTDGRTPTHDRGVHGRRALRSPCKCMWYSSTQTMPPLSAFCKRCFKPLDVNANNGLLQLDSQSNTFSHPHWINAVAVGDLPQGRPSVWLNIALVRDVCFTAKSHFWDQVLHPY